MQPGTEASTGAAREPEVPFGASDWEDDGTTSPTTVSGLEAVSVASDWFARVEVDSSLVSGDSFSQDFALPSPSETPSLLS